MSYKVKPSPGMLVRLYDGKFTTLLSRPAVNNYVLAGGLMKEETIFGIVLACIDITTIIMTIPIIVFVDEAFFDPTNGCRLDHREFTDAIISVLDLPDQCSLDTVW